MLTELRALETEQLKEMVFKLKIKLIEYRFQLSQGGLKNTSLIKLTKRTVAQLLTILNERKESFSDRDIFLFLNREKEKNAQVAANQKK